MWQWWPAWSDHRPLRPQSLGLGPSEKCPRPSDRGHRHSQGQAQGPVIWWSFTIWRPIHHSWATGTRGQVQQGLGAAYSLAWCHERRGWRGVIFILTVSVSADWPCALPLAGCLNGRRLTKLPVIAQFLGKRSQRYLWFWLYCPLYRGESLWKGQEFGVHVRVRAVPEIIFGGGGGANTFLSCGGRVFCWQCVRGVGSNLSWGSRHIWSIVGRVN